MSTVVRSAADDRKHCTTGSVFSQPGAQLRPEFALSQCGSLDAPEYVPIGGAFNVVFGSTAGIYLSTHREDA